MVGRVRAFIRLSGCNLHCHWCDTAYTWNWRGAGFAHERDEAAKPHAFDPREEITVMGAETAAARLLELGAPGVVITGGEPLVQSAGVLALAKALRAADRSISLELETNGTKSPDDELAALFDLLVVSPKLGHSRNTAEAALVPAVLDDLAKRTQAVFKFVAAEPADIAQVQAIAAAHAIPPAKIWIMPKGITSQGVNACGAAIKDAVMGAGFSYSDRLHVHLFGAARGV